MSLPNGFDTHTDYFKHCFDFLYNNQSFFNFANTDIMLNNTLSLCKEILKENCDENDYFKEINDQIVSLTPVYSEEKLFSSSNEINIRGLNCKKAHEIFRLTDFIGQHCQQVHNIIDFGCGLGYLSQLINEKFNFNVLGIEGNALIVENAIKRQKKYFPSSCEKVHYVHHFITIDSIPFLIENSQKYFGEDNRFIITGLHACADLTIDAVKLFLNIENCKGIVIMPCCYHKMKERHENLLNDDSNINHRCLFSNFPLSESMIQIYNDAKAWSFLRQPFLRLSCQRSCFAWELDKENHKRRIFNLMSRALLQLYAFNEKCKLVKKKRKAVSRLKSDTGDFELFLQDAINNGYELHKIRDIDEVFNASGRTDKISEIDAEKLDFDCAKIRSMWKELGEDDFEAATLLTRIQDSMQKFCENLVLLDKIAYLEEQKSSKTGLKNLTCRFVKISDEKISPRCLALVSFK